MNFFNDLFSGNNDPEVDVLSTTSTPLKTTFAKPRATKGRDFRGSTNRSTFDDPAMNPENQPEDDPEEFNASEDQYPEGYIPPPPPPPTPSPTPSPPPVSGTPAAPPPSPTITEDTFYGPRTPSQFLNPQPAEQPPPPPNPHVDAHPENTHSLDHNNTEAETTGMDLGQTLQTQPEEVQAEGSAGGAEDRPTYEGKINMKGEIITKVIDAVSDVVTEYILNKDDNRRRLRGVPWTFGNVIPQQAIEDIGGPNARVAMDRIAFANTFMGSPQTAITGAAISMIKQRIDAIDGTNPFEEVGRTRSDQKLRDIKLFRSIDSYITKSREGDSLVEKAKHYLVAEAQDITAKATNRMKDLGFIHKEEYRFIRSAVVMPYIILAIGFYFAYHKRDLDVNEYHGVFRDLVLVRIMKFILKKTLGLDKDIANFGIDILENVPQELVTAFVRNIDAKSGVFDNEMVAIKNFVEFIRKEYRETFGGGYYKDVRKLQGSNIDLVGLMNSLHTSRVLHLFAIQISTADNVVWEAINNSGLFLGLLELAAIHARGRQDEGGGELSQDTFLHNSFAVGLVRFKPLGSLPRPKKENKLLSILFELDKSPSTEKFRVVKDGNDYLVAISGSKFERQEGEIIDTDYETNLENVAGSPDFLKTDRYLNAQRALEEAIEEAKKTNGTVKVAGYSLGGRIALQLASHYHSIPFYIYEPVVAINDQTDKLFRNIQNANVRIHRINGSSISKHVEDYRKKYRFHLQTLRQKRLSAHAILNFS